MMKAVKRANGSDFKALELKLTEGSKSPHTIFFKEHSVRDQSSDRPSGRTLFIINVPPYADEQGIKNAFLQAGNIKAVQFAEKPSASETNNDKKFIHEPKKTCFRVAYAIFDKVSHLDKALKLTELCPMNSKGHKVKVGVKKWVDEYNSNVWQPKQLKEAIETFMKAHDSQMEKAEKKEKELEQEDDDGWITVTKKSKVKNFARSENVENKIMAKEERNKKRKELKNFYTFQIRESKMKNIVALRQKFEEDKQKIQQIKQSRRFKPF